MKKLTFKSKTLAIIKSRSGETLVESAISIVVFSILMLVVTMTLQTATHIANTKLAEANVTQEAVNRVVLEQSTGTPVYADIKYHAIINGVTYDGQMDVKIFSDKSLQYFKPAK